MNKENDEPDQNLISYSLHKVATGTGIILFGMLLSIFLQFLSRILIARYWTAAEFGVFSLSISIFYITSSISTLGFRQGLTRNIAYTRNGKKFDKISNYISFSIISGLIFSIVLGFILFLFSESLALNVFNDTSLVNPLKIISACIPFLTIIQIIISVYRGFDKVRPVFYFEHLLINVIFVILIITVIFANISFINVFYSFLVSLIIALFLIILYSFKDFVNIRKYFNKLQLKNDAKELLIFSLPVLGSTMLRMIVTWTDTIMIGAIKNTVDVGFYSIAHDIAIFIQFPLSALLFIYLPLLTGLHAKKKNKEIIKIYKIISKWLVSLSLPFFLFIFLFTNESIIYPFGQVYVDAVLALRILAIACLFNVIAGPCGETLIAMGKSKFMLYATLTTAVINLLLNFLLIPKFGIVGASIATSISIIFINILRMLKLYKLGKIHSFSKNLVKPAIITTLILIPIYILLFRGIVISLFMTATMFIIFYLVYLIIFLGTKSIDKEDIDLLKMLEQKNGKNNTKIRLFLQRFT